MADGGFPSWQITSIVLPYTQIGVGEKPADKAVWRIKRWRIKQSALYMLRHDHHQSNVLL